MKRFFSPLLPLAALLLGCVAFLHAAAAQQSSPTPAPVPRQGQGYEAFRMVRTRNVFDPERKALPPQNGARQATTPAPTRGDYVALTGTMVTPDKALAFFSGSRPDYNKVLPPQERIVGATILKVTPTDIEVERDGKRFTVAVGQTVPLDNASAPAAAPAPAAGDASSAPDAASAAPPPSGVNIAPANNPPPANKDEVLRRLMERRQQELK
ncbi:MAG: hypothetical protein JO117_09205 [Verrucomicrobia bacterium]|nr:hypothetical protein [Verrucomicrobiota bacterium]